MVMKIERFEDVYEQARRTRAAIYGFIKYLIKYKENKTTNRKPGTVNGEPGIFK